MDSGERRQPAPWLEELVARSDGPVEVQVSPEILVDFPVEVFDETGPGFVRAGSLGISVALQQELIVWLRWWQVHVNVNGDEVIAGDEDEWRRWERDGSSLRERLQQELGPDFSVRSG